MSDDMSSGTLPDGWEVRTLSDVAKWGSGGTPKAGTSRFYENGSIPWAIIGDLNDGVVLDTAASITNEAIDESSAKIVAPGTVLMAMYGSIGKLGIAGIPMATNQAIAFATVFPDRMSNMYLFHFLFSQRFVFVRSGKGATQQNISQTILKPWPIPVPPLAEQEKIVEILEEQLSRLDAALEAVRRVRVKAAQFRRSLLHAAFTGALTGHDTSTGAAPEGWTMSTVGQVAKVVGGRTPAKFEQRLEEASHADRVVPFYKVGDMNTAPRFLDDARVYFAVQEAQRFGIEILEAGTVIFPKAGGAIATNKKRVLMTAGAIDLNCMAVVPKPELDGRLLYWFFESFDLSSLADGSVLPQIGKRRVSELEVCFPIDGQQQSLLVDQIEANLSKSDAGQAIADAVEKRAAALRRSLLHAAFTGNLTKEWRENAHV